MGCEVLSLRCSIRSRLFCWFLYLQGRQQLRLHWSGSNTWCKTLRGMRRVQGAIIQVAAHEAQLPVVYISRIAEMGRVDVPREQCCDYVDVPSRSFLWSHSLIGSSQNIERWSPDL